jgi:putative membrane protein
LPASLFEKEIAMGPNYWWGHGFGFMWVVPLLFLAVCVFFMRGMFGRSSGGGSGRTQPDSAGEILDRRFANGEISKDEYEDMKKALGNGRH